ncbi:MAG: AsmA family protein [Acidobacteria bacterium]|nr:AsmA family protein [Acidobacteriota bacterium]
MRIRTAFESFRSSRWRNVVLITAGAILLLLAILFIAPKFVDINAYRGQIIAQLEQRLGRSVKLGAMELSLLPSIRIKVDDVAIGDDPQFARGEFVKALSVKLQIGLWSLLTGAPEVSGIELLEPSVTLIKGSESKWNWSTLKPLQSAEKDSSQAPFDLLVRDGRFTLIDRSADPAVERNYTGVNIALDDFSPRQAFDFVIGLSIAGKGPGEKAGQVEIEGEAGPIDSEDASRTPVDARVRMEDADLAGLESLFGVLSQRAGRLTTDVNIRGRLADGLKAEGRIKADQLRMVEGVEPAGDPLEAEFALTARSEEKSEGQSEISLAIDQCEVRLGETKASVSGRVNRIPGDPLVDLRFKGDGVALDSLLESAYAFGFGPPPGTKASGAATVDLQLSGDARSIALNGQAEFRDLKFQSSSMQQAMSVSELKLNCNPGEITAAPFRATLSRTAVEFNNLKISDYGKQPRAHLDVATNNAQLDDLIKIAESFGARPDMSGGGNASLKASIDTVLGEAGGATGGATKISGSGKLSDARLQMSGAAKPVEVANADLNFSGDSLRVDNLAARLGSSQTNGWLQVKNFDQPFLTFDLKADQLIVSELQQTLGSGQSPQAKKPTSGSIRADGQLAVGKLILEGLTATDMRSKVAMANQTLTLDPLSLKLYGGAYQGAVRIDQSQNPAEIALNGRFNGLDINQFLSSSGQRSAIYGRADGSLNVRGRTGDSSDALAKSLVGNGFVAISGGKFTSFDLMKQVELLGRLVNLPTGGAGTAFRSLKTNLRFDRGRMTTDAAQLIMDDLSVTGEGVMQLGDAPTVDYNLLARLSPALTKRVMPQSAESGAGSILQSIGKVTARLGAFFVEQDSMVVPLKMSGPLNQPAFGLNTSILERRAKDQLVESLSDKLNKGLGKESGKEPGKEPGKDAGKPKPADLLKGILDNIKRKEKP